MIRRRLTVLVASLTAVLGSVSLLHSSDVRAEYTVYCVGTDAAGVLYGEPCDGIAAQDACNEAGGVCGFAGSGSLLNYGYQSGGGCWATCQENL